MENLLPVWSLEEKVSSDQYQTLYCGACRLEQLVLEKPILLQVPAGSNLLHRAGFTSVPKLKRFHTPSLT